MALRCADEPAGWVGGGICFSGGRRGFFFKLEALFVVLVDYALEFGEGDV